MYNRPSHEPVLVMTSTRIVRTTRKSQRGKRWLHIYGDQSFTDEILLNKDYVLIILTYKVNNEMYYRSTLNFIFRSRVNGIQMLNPVRQKTKTKQVRIFVG